MNYFNVKISNKNVSQNMAKDLFLYLSNRCRIKYFSFCEYESILYRTRGYTEIEHILEKYGIGHNDLEVQDEFGTMYDTLKEE